MNNLFDECDNSVTKLKNRVDDIIKSLGMSPISPELQQKFHNFNNQLNTYEKSIENKKDIHEIFKLAKAVGLQTSVLGNEVQKDKLVADSIKLLAKEVVLEANTFREWVETREESGKPYQSTISENNKELYNEKIKVSKKIKSNSVNQDKVIKNLENCIVKINTPYSACTGFFISANIIATVSFIVENDFEYKDIEIIGGNVKHSIKKLEFDRNIDLLLITVDTENDVFVELEESIEIGDKCFSLGYIDDSNKSTPLTLEYEGQRGDDLQFKGGQVQRGYGGSPILNLVTLKVCAVIVKTRDEYSNLGGYGVSVSNFYNFKTFLMQNKNSNISFNKNINIVKKSEIRPVLGVKSIAKTLSSIIIHQPDDSGMMIGIFGKWGRGKTFLAEQTWKELKNDKPKFKRIIFSAWKYQDTTSLWAYLYENFIDSYLDKQEEKTLKDKMKNYYSTTKKIWKLNLEKHKWFPVISFGLLLILAIVWTFFVDKIWLIKLLISTFGIVVLIKFFLLYISQKESAIGLYRKYFSKKSYNDYLGFQSEVEHELTNLLKTWIPEANKDEKIILFVDDIDRCNIEQIILIIDGLRVILDNPVIHERLIIITAIDEEILKVALRHKYENIEDDRLSTMYKEYLEKIFIVGLKLNALNNNQVQEFLTNIFPKEKTSVSQKEFVDIPENNPSQNDAPATNPKHSGSSSKRDDDLPENSAKQRDDYEISNSERGYLLEVIKKLKNPTPRKVRIFYYKYLIMKQLFHIRLKEKGLIQGWHDNSDETVIADILVHMANGEDFEKFGNDKNEEIINELKYVANMVSVL